MSSWTDKITQSFVSYRYWRVATFGDEMKKKVICNDQTFTFMELGTTKYLHRPGGAY